MYMPKDPCRVFGGHVASYKPRQLPWDLQPDRNLLRRRVVKRVNTDTRNPFTSKVAAPCLRRLLLFQGSPYAGVQNWNPNPGPASIQPKPKRYYSLVVGGIPYISFTCSLEAVSYQKTLAKYISPDTHVLEEML